MTLLTWIERANAIKVRHGSKTKRGKKKEKKKELRAKSSWLNKDQGLKMKERKKRASGLKRK